MMAPVKSFVDPRIWTVAPGWDSGVRHSSLPPWEANSRVRGCGLGLAGQVESGFELAIGLLNLGDPVPYFLGQPTCGRAELSRPLDGLFSAFEQLGRGA